VGYGEDEEKFKRLWPADLHIIGKDILRFHAIIWPGMLISASLLPPSCIFAHGWWTVEGEKMSKSLGNVIDPFKVVKRVGADGLRYFLLREVPFGQDGDFSEEALLHRVNSELANDLGNLVKRVTTLVVRHFYGKAEKGRDGSEYLRNLALSLPGKVDEAMEQLKFQQALCCIWSLVHACNKYMDSTAPWRLITEGKREEAKCALYNLLESIRILAILLHPFLPTLSKRIWRSIGMSTPLEEQRKKDVEKWGLLPSVNVHSLSIYERIK
jgi:methionyl-tRNA synthetase